MVKNNTIEVGDLGQRLLKYRFESDLSLRELAKRTRTSKTTVGNLSSGRLLRVNKQTYDNVNAYLNKAGVPKPVPPSPVTTQEALLPFSPDAALRNEIKSTNPVRT